MDRQSTRIIALLLGTLALSCAKSAGPLGEPPPEDRTAQLAAYAAGAAPPRGPTTSESLHITAVVRSEDHTITLHNFSDRRLQDVEVWVDATYVRRIPDLPARGEVTVHYAQFFDARGTSLAARPASIGQVQLKVDGSIHDAIGPAHD